MGGSLSVGIGGGGSSDRNSVPLAGGQSKVGRTNQFQGIVEKKGIRGFWQVVAGGKRREVPIKGEDQQFAGAEAMFDQIARPVDIQIAAFAQVYSKVQLQTFFVAPIFYEAHHVTMSVLGNHLPSSQPRDNFRHQRFPGFLWSSSHDFRRRLPLQLAS